MTQQQSVDQLIRIGAANQPKYIEQQLRVRGLIESPYSPPGSVLESGLYKLYVNDRDGFWSIMQGLTFDPTVTNSSTANNTLTDLAAANGYTENTTRGVTLKGAWDWLVGTLGGTDTTNVAPTVVTTSSTNIGAVIGLVIVAILAVTLVYFAFFKKSA